MTTIIGYDPGFGNTKLFAGDQPAVIPSAVSRPRNTGAATIGMKRRKVTTVEFFNCERYAVGTGAWSVGELLTSMDYGALVSAPRLALMYAGLAALDIWHAGGICAAKLVVGLPVPLLSNEEQFAQVKAALRELKREHEFSVCGVPYVLNIEAVSILAQPTGAYLDWLYQPDGTQRANAGKTETAIIDLGMNTLDLYAFRGAEVQETYIGGAEVGVRRMLERISADEFGHDVMELDDRLRAGAPLDERYSEAWLAEVLGAIKTTFKNLRRFDAVILTGGGVKVLGQQLERALVARGAHVYTPDDPVTANVRGFWRYGVNKRG